MSADESEQQPPAWLPRALLYVFIGIGAFMLATNIVRSLTTLLTTLLVALFVSFAVEPAVDRLEERGWKRGRATALVFVGVFVIGGIGLSMMVGLVVEQVGHLVDEAPQFIRDATAWVNKRFDAKITADSLIRQIQQYQGDIASTAGDVGGRVLSVTNSVVGSVFQVFTVGLFAFYLVADGPQFRRSICSVLRPERQRVVLGLWELAIAKTGGYLYSRMLLAAVCSMTSWVVFTVLGISSPLALALWIGVVSQFIPVIGTYIGGLIPALVALLASPTTALIVLVFIIVYQQIENYFLSPKITARTMEIHPAVAFGSAIAGASIMGAAGALLALPAAAIIQAFVSSYLERHEVVDSSLTVVVGEATVVSEAVTPEAVSAVVSDQSRDAEKSGQSKPES